jgi:hypothetical protein
MVVPPSLSPSSVVALTGNKSDSCQLSTQNATNHEGQMTGVHGMGGYWTGLDHERWHSGVSGAFANNIGKDVGKGGDFSFVQISDSHMGSEYVLPCVGRADGTVVLAA